MSICVTTYMAKDTEFMELYKKTPTDKKEFVRATILEEAAEYLNKRAFEDFGMHNKAVGMALSKLILKAKECEEREAKSSQ